MSKIQNLPNYQTLKNDVELVLYGCNTLENAHAELKASKLNKRQLVVSVFAEIFNLNDEEKLTLSNTIQFLFDHNKIKQIKQVLVVGNVLKNWFIKKFGWLIIQQLPPIQALIIKQELIITNILLKVGFSKMAIPLILLFL